MKITVLDPIMSMVDKPALVKPVLKYQREKWWDGPHKKEHKTYDEYLINLKTGMFLTGLVPKIKSYCEQSGIPLEIEGETEKPQPKKPFLNGITFREDQERMILDLLNHQRGVATAPPGVGKTVLAGAIISAFPQYKSLFLCGTVSILLQTFADFKKWGLNPSLYGNGKKDLSGDVVVSTVQSLVKVPTEDLCSLFGVVVVDEEHHAWESIKWIRKGGHKVKVTGQYYDVLTKLLAQVRIGVSATPPSHKNQEAKLVNEGLLGPVITELSMEEGINLGILAKPEIKFIKPSYNIDTKDMRRYADIYRNAVELNRFRNRAVATKVKELADEGITSLVYVSTIMHGNILHDIISEKASCKFVQGSVDGEIREEIRKDLHDKKISCVIATSAWKEGVNIPSIGAIILAGGGKSETAVIQTVGRGLRRAEGKNTVYIYDVIDIGKYISEHFAQRMSIYADQGWI